MANQDKMYLVRVRHKAEAEGASKVHYRIGRHPSQSTISNKNISEASRSIFIKFNVNHHQVGD